MAYTNIDDPSAHFQTALHSSTNAATITNDGNSDLKPDLIWSKARGAAYNHALYDSTRGVTKFLKSNSTNAETTASSGFDLTSFNTDGFSTGNNQFNTICGGTTYVAWQWKANGGTTASNSDGTITSTVQANTTAGFSIITYTGTGSAGTIGHGLGVKPDIIIFKRRNGTNNWDFQFKGEARLTLNLTDAQATNVLCTFTSTTTDLGSTATAEKNANGGTYIAYAFAEKQGYSKFGSYVGNGNANGPFIYTGFKPAFVMVKRSDGTSDWTILDNKREGYNLINKRLVANSSAAEATYNVLDFVSNGFKFRDGDGIWNGSGSTYIFMAFAENPFTTSSGIPTTAR